MWGLWDLSNDKLLAGVQGTQDPVQVEQGPPVPEGPRGQETGAGETAVQDPLQPKRDPQLDKAVAGGWTGGKSRKVLVLCLSVPSKAR